MNSQSRFFYFLMMVILFTASCNQQEQATVQISSTTYRPDAPKSTYNISELTAQAPKTPVDISGIWLGSTQYSPTVNLTYKLILAKDGDDYNVTSFTDADNGMKLGIWNFRFEYPVLRFDADSSLFDGHMIPQPFSAEFVVLGDEIKGHFREIKTKNSKNTTYYNYDTDFLRAK